MSLANKYPCILAASASIQQWFFFCPAARAARAGGSANAATTAADCRPRGSPAAKDVLRHARPAPSRPCTPLQQLWTVLRCWGLHPHFNNYGQYWGFEAPTPLQQLWPVPRCWGLHPTSTTMDIPEVLRPPPHPLHSTSTVGSTEVLRPTPCNWVLRCLGLSPAPHFNNPG